MCLDDVIVDLVEGIHEDFLVMFLDELSSSAVFVQLSQECSELDPFIAVFDVLEEDVAGVLLEDVEGED